MIVTVIRCTVTCGTGTLSKMVRDGGSFTRKRVIASTSVDSHVRLTRPSGWGAYEIQLSSDAGDRRRSRSDSVTSIYLRVFKCLSILISRLPKYSQNAPKLYCISNCFYWSPIQSARNGGFSPKWEDKDEGFMLSNEWIDLRWSVWERRQNSDSKPTTDGVESYCSILTRITDWGMYWASKVSRPIRRTHEPRNQLTLLSGLQDPKIYRLPSRLDLLAKGLEVKLPPPKSIQYLGLGSSVVFGLLTNHRSQWTTNDVQLEDGEGSKCANNIAFFLHIIFC